MDQLDLLRYVFESLERLSIPHMLVGSFASGAYGEPRFTQDIDVVLELSADRTHPFCEAFPAPEFFVSEQAVRESVTSRYPFNVLHPSSGNKIDFMLPRDDLWGRSQLQRRRNVLLAPGLHGFIASPEDVILGKMWYYSEGQSDKHLRDIAGMLRARGDEIDRAAIRVWADSLGMTEVWKKILERAA